MTIRPSIAVAAVVVAATAVTVPALAQSGGASTLTFSELEQHSTFHFVDASPKTRIVKGRPRRISGGDAFVFTNPVADATGTIGELRGICTAAHTARRFERAGFFCRGVFVLRTGTLVAELADVGASTTTGAIVGGTGAYAGARGTFTSTDTPTGSDDVVTLLP